MNIYQKVKSFNFPKRKYVVCAGSALEGYGIRKSGDLDIAVTKDVYKQLKNKGWRERVEPNGFKGLKKDDCEVAFNFNCGGYTTTTKHLIKTASVRNGIPLMSLKEILKFKKTRNSEKDKRDVKLIKQYLQFRI